MQFASTDRPYPCTICGKRFTQKAHLIIHKRTHTGEKPYSCHICHKRFAQTSHLAVHKRVHTGEKPFFCNYCGMGFCRRPRLEAHILQHMVKDGRPSELVRANQESLDAAAQLIELKMKGGGGGEGGGPFSQVKSEPSDTDDSRMRSASINKGGNVLTEMGYTCKDAINIIDDEDKGVKKWDERVGGASDELDRLNSGLTELTNIQQQALNKAIVMPTGPQKLLSPNSYHMKMMTSHHQTPAMAAVGNPSLTMSGLVRTNSRVSLIDFTAEDILQHLLSRDDIKSCDFCCLVFRDPGMYYLHRSMHDKMDVRCCNLCGKLLKDKYDFTAHYLNQHK